MEKKLKIVVLDGHAANPGDLSWEPFKEFGDVTLYERTNPDEMIERAKDADAVLVNKLTFNEAVMKQLPKLKYIGILATGTNTVDTLAAAKHGITVTNIPAYSTDSVAQLTFAHILNVINRVDKYADDVRKGRWSMTPDFCYWDGKVHELSSLTMGIVGLGNIGQKVAQIALAFGMNIYAFTSKAVNDLPLGVQKSTLNGLFNSCDIITLHCPLTPETRGMINKQTLAMMRPETIIVNTARGPLVNEVDMAEALTNGTIAAYATDVMSKEPPQKDNPLFGCNNAFITPHLAWGTIEARERLMQIALANVRAFVNGNPVNIVK